MDSSATIDSVTIGDAFPERAVELGPSYYSLIMASANAPPAWWYIPLITVASSLLVFGLGYLLVQRKQLRPIRLQLDHLKAQLVDRNARLAAAQASESLALAKAIEKWSNIIGEQAHGGATLGHLLPEAESIDSTERLANDPELKSLLARLATELRITKETGPESLINEVLIINRDPELTQRFGTVDIDENKWTPDQREFLAPVIESWESRRAVWNEHAAQLAKVAGEMRTRAEFLLRSWPSP